MPRIVNTNPLSIVVPNDLTIKAIFVPDDSTTSTAVDTVRISTGGNDASEVLFVVGQSETFYVTAFSSNGKSISQTQPITWFSSDPSVAEVLAGSSLFSNGLGYATVTGKKNGITNIQASVGNVLSNVITIKIGTPSVEITPSSPTVNKDRTIQLNAVYKNQSGTVIARPITWESADNTIATVSQTGLVTGINVGNTVIRARSDDGYVSSVPLTVTQIVAASVEVIPSSQQGIVGSSLTFSAIVKDSFGNILPGRKLRWESSNLDVALIERNIQVGDQQASVSLVTSDPITVKVNKEGEANLRVTDVISNVYGFGFVNGVRSPYIVRVSPPTSNIFVNSTVRLSAEAIDSSRQRQPYPVDRWESDNPTVATVDQNGNVVGKSIGIAVIRAYIGDVVGTANVTVSEVIIIPTPTPTPSLNVVLSPTPTPSPSPTPTPTPSQNILPTPTPSSRAFPTPTPSLILWRDCASGALNTGTPPSGFIRTVYTGAGGGFCWEPPSTVGFAPSLQEALNFTYQRGSSSYPEPKTITATNPSYSKSYRITLTTNNSIKLSIGNSFSSGTLSFTLAPRQQTSFIVTVTPELLRLLGDGDSVIDMTVNIVEL